MSNETLSRAVRAMPGPVFAILDGAQFEDMPSALARIDLRARSLFLGQSDYETQKSGPWLADTYSRAGLERLLDLIADKPAAVFWSYPRGEAALYDHLRRINAATVPLLRPDAPPGPNRNETDYEPTLALFRHWDPRVLVDVLPVLDGAQFAQVLGAANRLVMADEDGRVVEAAPVPGEIEAPRGGLTLSIAQIETLAGVRAEKSRRRIARFLQDHSAIDGRAPSEDEALDMVRASEASGREMGLETERGLGRWAYLMMMTRGRAAQTPEVRAYLTSGQAPADDLVAALLGHTARALRAGAGEA